MGTAQPARRPARRWAVAMASTMLAALVASATTAATTSRATAASLFTVTTTFDTGPGSLRQAVLDANANPGRDVIQVLLGPAYVINLSSGITSTDELIVLGNGVTLTLEGPPGLLWTHTGGSALSFSGLRMVGTQPRVGGISSDGPVQITGSSFSNLQAIHGGAVAAASVWIRSSGFTGNQALTGDWGDGGGAINATGTVVIDDSTFVENATPNGGSGGAVFTSGDVFVTNSLFQGNEAGPTGRGGGAVMSDNGAVVQIAGSSFLGNTAGDQGGSAINANASSAIVTISNSTFAGNVASPTVDAELGTLALSFVTFLDNIGSAPVDVRATNLASFGSVFAGTSASHCLVGTPTSQGYNVEQATNSCGLTGPTDVPAGGDPGLGPVGLNGGPTPTSMPQTGSLLLNRIPVGSPGCTSRDQRGVTRPQATGCDIGAVEVEVILDLAASAEPTSLRPVDPSGSLSWRTALPAVATPRFTG